MEIGIVAAFLGGVLALLSPCSALLLPAFFASTLGSSMRLIGHGLVFFVGLAVTLVPLGLGIGALGTLFMERRGLIIGIASALMIVLGLIQLLGFGFDLSKLAPGTNAIRSHATSGTGVVKTFLLGAVSGVAGFCAGPILGAVLTLALGQGSAVRAGVLLAVYALGMVVPLVIIAALWGRIGARSMRILRGRAFSVFGRDFHTTSVVTGALIIAVGILFWTTNGLVGLPSLVPTSVQAWLQQQGALLSGPVIDIAAVVIIALALLAVWAISRKRGERSREGLTELQESEQ